VPTTKKYLFKSILRYSDKCLMFICFFSFFSVVCLSSSPSSLFLSFNSTDPFIQQGSAAEDLEIQAQTKEIANSVLERKRRENLQQKQKVIDLTFPDLSTFERRICQQSQQKNVSVRSVLPETFCEIFRILG